MKTVFSVIVSGILLSASASAHLLEGTYTGKDQNGAACSFVVGQTFFERNEHHPLNERIVVESNDLVWNVMHPPAIDVAKGHVRFDHDHFHQLAPRAYGAEGILIEADHDTKMPKSMLWFNDFYKEPAKSQRVECRELVHTPKTKS